MDVRRWAGVVGIACLCTLFASPRWRALGYMPGRVAVDVGDRVRLSAPLPLSVGMRLDGAGRKALDVDGRPLVGAWRHLPTDVPVVVRAHAVGRYAVAVGAFGLALRRVEVDSVAAPRVVAGGQSIGIRVRTAGLLVVGRATGTAWPAFGAGHLEAGDRIVEAEGVRVSDEEDLRRAVQSAGKKRHAVRLRVMRAGRAMALAVRPRLDDAAVGYRLGVVVREGLSGIGTLTFFEPASGLYVALGHRIQDGWSGQSVPVAAGRISGAPISGVRRGFIGRPGEKVGRLTDDPPRGSVEGSGPYGIFGRLSGGYAEGPTIRLATADQVHAGPASMFTVVAGNRVERFRVRIERVDRRAPGGRGMVVRVVDPDLLRRTGGIVQGMSGSPIEQDGRLIGALTHVLVSDNTRGYGVFASWMWQEAQAGTTDGAKYPRHARLYSTSRAG